MGGKVYKRQARAESAKVWFEVESESGQVLHFNCNDYVPGGVILAFAGEDTDAAIAVASAEEKEEAALQAQMDRGKEAILATKNVFKHAVVKAQQKLFWDCVNGAEDAPVVIDIEMLLGIAQDLAGEYSARPTGASSPDGQPRTSTGSESTPGPAGAVVTYSLATPLPAST